MVVREVEAVPTAVVAAATTWEAFPQVWPGLLDEVWAFLRAGGATVAGQSVMLYVDDLPVVEVGVVVDGPFEPDGDVVPSQLPAGRVATTTHHGSWHRIGEAHEAVLAWCGEHGHETTGVRWEVYGDWQEDEAALTAEVSWLLR